MNNNNLSRFVEDYMNADKNITKMTVKNERRE
jgi:hypothetical protein